MDETKDLADAYDAQKNKYMTFKSGSEFFGLKIEYVNEIISYQTITAVPETADYIKGLINLRGKILPVIDVQLRFRQDPLEYNDRTCIIVIKVKDTMVGLIVEEIADIVEITEDNILPPPSISRTDTKNTFVYGIGKVGDSVKLLLDPDKLINEEDLSAVEQSGNTGEEEREVSS